MNYYFDEETLKKITENISVNEILEEMALELRKITNGKADISLIRISIDETKKLFGEHHFEEGYYIYIRYTKNKEQKRNRFCAISYNDSFPLFVRFLKGEPSSIKRLENCEQFKEYFKYILQSQSVLASVRSAIRMDDVPENFSEENILRMIAKELIKSEGKDISKNALTFLEYWKNNYMKE